MVVDLVDLLYRYPVWEAFCVFIDNITLVRLSRTCSALYKLRRGEWNLNRLMSRFVENPKGFRDVMRQCGAVISGGLALQFFARKTWEESDMDVFVKDDECACICGYLVETEGYTLEHSHDSAYPIWHGKVIPDGVIADVI